MRSFFMFMLVEANWIYLNICINLQVDFFVNYCSTAITSQIVN